jgi:dTDP-4-amino-4,6-dideoxygalactose transaminase
MYHHEEVGFNSRLDALQAVVLLAKLPHLEAWSAARRARPWCGPAMNPW